MRRIAVVTPLLAVALAMLGTAPPGAPPDPRPVGLHAVEYAAHVDDPPFPPGPPLPADVVAAARAWEESRPHRSRSDIEVIGYLPYWMDDGPDGLRYDVLTVVNYFAAHVEPDGDLSDLNGWGGEASEQLVTQAHAAGCRVALTVANFDDDELHDLLSSPSNRANAIEQLLDQVLAMNADGVDVDFEGMDTADKPHLTSFMQEMQAEFEAAMPDPWLTLATPAVDWSGAYDYDELMYASNGCFFMGYGYHWSAGDPGPLAPKSSSATWGSYCLSWSIEDYLESGGEDNPHGINMGLPLYGRSWPTTDNGVPGEATEEGTSVVWASSHSQGQATGRLWDSVTSTPYTFPDSTHQLWYDDVESLEIKIDWIVQEGIQGLGFWALTYDDADPDLWTMVDALTRHQGGQDSEPDTTDSRQPDTGEPPAQDSGARRDDPGYRSVTGRCACAGRAAPAPLALLPLLLALVRRRSAA